MANRRIATGLLLAALLLATSGVALANDYGCYLPIRIIDAGTTDVNGQAFFAGFADGKPYYVGRDVRVEWDSGPRRWVIYDTSSGSDVSVYTNSRNEPTPPSRGWRKSGGLDPEPRIDGGEPCPVIVPTGEGGEGAFLDRGLDLAEGETPPIAGELYVTAVYSVGELVTGSCQILDPDGDRPVLSYVHIYIYSVDVTARPDHRDFVTHWMAPHNWETREYEIEWDTTGQPPGYYDVHLAFEGGGYATLRIELVAP